MFFVVFLVCACSTPVTKTQFENAKFSARPTNSEAVALIASYMQNILIDPNSLLLKCSHVTGKGWARQFATDEPVFGHIVLCTVNAKNKLGGYTGQKPYIYVINGSKITAFEFNTQPWAEGQLHALIEKYEQEVPAN